MPTLGEILNKGNKNLYMFPKGFELKKTYDMNGMEKLRPNGSLKLNVFGHHTFFSGYCPTWDEVVRQILICLNRTRQIKCDVSLTFKHFRSGNYEEIFHGKVTQEVLDELIEISKEYFKDEE